MEEDSSVHDGGRVGQCMMEDPVTLCEMEKDHLALHV